MSIPFELDDFNNFVCVFLFTLGDEFNLLPFYVFILFNGDFAFVDI